MRFVSPLLLGLVATTGLACAHGDHKDRHAVESAVAAHDGVEDGHGAHGRKATLVHFDLNKATITAEDQPRLDALAAALLRHENVEIAIVGNTDETGTAEHNLELGQARAEAAKAYLVKRGVSADRIAAVSYGAENPVDGGASPDAHAANRRDEVIVK